MLKAGFLKASELRVQRGIFVYCLHNQTPYSQILDHHLPELGIWISRLIDHDPDIGDELSEMTNYSLSLVGRHVAEAALRKKEGGDVRQEIIDLKRRVAKIDGVKEVAFSLFRAVSEETPSFLFRFEFRIDVMEGEERSAFPG
jgi:hypothetical protein